MEKILCAARAGALKAAGYLLHLLWSLLSLQTVLSGEVYTSMSFLIDMVNVSLELTNPQGKDGSLARFVVIDFFSFLLYLDCGCFVFFTVCVQEINEENQQRGYKR